MSYNQKKLYYKNFKFYIIFNLTLFFVQHFFPYNAIFSFNTNFGSTLYKILFIPTYSYNALQIYLHIFLLIFFITDFFISFLNID